VWRKPPALARWGLLLGDCLHNLRCALDHALYAVAIAESGVNPPPDAATLQFPITSSAAAFDAARRRIRSLSAAAQRAIEAWQPYNSPQETADPLLLLNELDNIDKHRSLHLGFFHLLRGDYVLSEFRHSGKVRAHKHAGVIESGTPLLTLWTEHPEPELHIKLDVTLFLAVAHSAGPDGFTNSEVDVMLESIRDRVTLVVSSLERLALEGTT